MALFTYILGLVYKSSKIRPKSTRGSIEQMFALQKALGVSSMPMFVTNFAVK
jgi:hypothetical protein